MRSIVKGKRTIAIVLLGGLVIMTVLITKGLERKMTFRLFQTRRIHSVSQSHFESTFVPQQSSPQPLKYFENNSTTEWYFLPREEQIVSYTYPFIIQSNQTCMEGETPFLIVLSITEYDHIDTRQVIRSTFGSVAQTKTWPLSNQAFSVKLVFITGIKNRGKMSEESESRVKEEIEAFGDIVIIDFDDTYTNLTIKMLMALKWVQTFCPGTKYILKADEDTFVHIPNVIRYLNLNGNYSRGQIHGHVLTVPIVNRVGKWKVSPDAYPFYRYPLYTSGTAYVISGNILNKLIYSAEHMPFIPNEDAFITGVLRIAVGAELCAADGFTYRVDPKPKLCSFHNNLRMVATNTDNALKTELWQALYNTSLKDCYNQRYLRIPKFPMDKWLTQSKLK